MADGHRYLFALVPEPRLARQIGVHRDERGPYRSLVSNERLHMTLAITADFAGRRPDVEEQMMQIGDTASAEPVHMALDQLSASYETIALRPKRRPPALGILQSQLWRRLEFRGLGRGAWSFNPHVTLGYRRGTPFEGFIAPLEWHATEFVLLHSLLGETRHVELGRWTLEKRQLDLLAL